jgi:hypothetical protein
VGKGETANIEESKRKSNIFDAGLGISQAGVELFAREEAKESAKAHITNGVALPMDSGLAAE